MKNLLPLVLALLIGSSPAISADERDPATIISEILTHILDELNERRAEFTENPDLLIPIVRDTMLPSIDVVYSARLILGRSGRGVSTEQLHTFSDALSNILINRYSSSLIEYSSGEQVQVMPMKGNNSEKHTRVRTRIELDRGGFVPVDFAFHMTDQGWKAFDVTVEGISYVLTFRNQISPRVQADGIDKVTADIIVGNVTFDEQ
jgi:phospholipid transport system substrate-binding protein